jgi:hypothetical protein
VNCLDCTTTGRAVAAVAVCHTCGAAVCADHAVVRPHHLTRNVPINQTVVIEPAARLVRCAVCDAAHEAATHHEHHHH